jgi:prepilin-type N-terminal cleavage/methylation domain-containing protein
MTAQRSIKESKGFTLVELLLALAISALLLTAVATAFNASVMNYRENREIYQTLNSARQALLRMTTQLRTGKGVLSESDEAATQCSFFTSEPDNNDVTYEFLEGDPHSADPEDRIGRLDLIVHGDDHIDRSYVLCKNVTAMTFTKTPPEGSDRTSVRISMTIRIGDQVQTLSSAVVIRRNLEL